MENKHELTEKLKIIETEIFNERLDYNCISSKLENAYKYEDELLRRMEFARKQTEQLRNELFQKSTAISKKYDTMKEIFNLFTGNFYGYK